VIDEPAALAVNTGRPPSLGEVLTRKPGGNDVDLGQRGQRTNIQIHRDVRHSALQHSHGTSIDFAEKLGSNTCASKSSLDTTDPSEEPYGSHISAHGLPLQATTYINVFYQEAPTSSYSRMRLTLLKWWTAAGERAGSAAGPGG
jgi:hypothetical protein